MPVFEGYPTMSLEPELTPGWGAGAATFFRGGFRMKTGVRADRIFPRAPRFLGRSRHYRSDRPDPKAPV